VKAIVCSLDKVPFLSGVRKSEVSSNFKHIIVIDDKSNPDAAAPEGTIKYSEIIKMGKVRKKKKKKNFFFLYKIFLFFFLFFFFL
jgi:hypothetical protein